jgi:tetratricopeptide (TPR) repeat protein
MSVNKEKTKKKASELASKGKYEAAAKELERIIEENPADIGTSNEIGDLYARSGRIKDAVKNFQSVAHHYSKEGFYAKAIAAYKKITKIDPRNNSVYFMLADLYIKEELRNDARESLIIAAQNYMDVGEKDRAKEAYEKILNLQPESIKVRIKLAEIYEKERSFEKAVSEYLLIGKALIEKNLDKEAQSVFEKILKIQSNNIEAANHLVDVYTRTGNNQQAVGIYNTLLKADPDNIDVLKAYGKTLYNINEIRKAGEIVRRLLDKLPDDVEALSIMSKISLQENKINEAFKYIQQVITFKFREGPDNTTVDLLKPLLEKDSYFLLALEKILEIYTTLSDITNTISAYEKLGVAYRHHKMWDKAIAAYNKVLDFNPENKKAQIAIAEIQKMQLDLIPRSMEQKDVDEDVIAAKISFDIPFDTAVKRPEETQKTPSVEPSHFAGTSVTGTVPAKEDISNEDIYEIEILIKYGLLDKAKDRLLDFSERFPKNKEIRKLLKAIYLEKGDKVKASIETMFLSEIYESENNKATASKLKEEAHDTLKNLHQMGAELPPEALAFIGFGGVAAHPARGIGSGSSSFDNGIEIVDLDQMDISQVEVSAGSVVIEDSFTENEFFKKELGVGPFSPAEILDVEKPSLPATDTAVKEPEITFDDRRLQFPDNSIFTELDIGKGSVRTPPSFQSPLPSQMDDQILGHEIEEFFNDGTAAAPAGTAVGAGAPGIEDTWNTELKIDDMFSEMASEENRFVGFNPAENSQHIPIKPAGYDELTDDEMESIFGHHPEHAIPELGEDLALHVFGEKTITDPRTLLFELEEVDFYISNEFFEEAKAKIKELQFKYPDHGGVKDRVKILAEKAAQSEIQKLHEDVGVSRNIQSGVFAVDMEQHDKEFESELNEFFSESPGMKAGLAKEMEPIEKPYYIFFDKDLFEEEEQFFNIASEIEHEFNLPEPTTNINLEAQLESIFDEFREEVNETLTDEDFDTRYNLGIAYKEMGLIDEAIHEFQTAFKGPHFKINAATMLGYCFLEKQRPPQAIQWFRMAMNNLGENIGSDEALGLKLALAKSYAANGEKQSAVNLLRDIAKVNPHFPGLSELVNELK